MDSAIATIERPESVPNEPGSKPLTNPKYERFAVLRAAMCGRLEAGREAGFPAMASYNLCKIERKPHVRARIDYLAKDTPATVAKIRSKVLEKLHVIADASIYDFVRMEKDPTQVKHLRDTIVDAKKRDAAIAALPVLPYLDLARIAGLAPEQQREILSAVKTWSYSDGIPRPELHDPLNAMTQLRKMTGLDAATDVNLSGGLTLEALVGASYKPKQIEQNDLSKQEAAE